MSISKFTFIRFTRGDQKAVEKVYLEYKNLMYFVIASYVPNKLDVIELFNQYNLRLTKAIHTYLNNF